MTLAGTVTSAGSVLARLTSRLEPRAVGMLTVPTAGPWPSVAFEGTVTVSGGCELTTRCNVLVALFTGEAESVTRDGQIVSAGNCRRPAEHPHRTQGQPGQRVRHQR